MHPTDLFSMQIVHYFQNRMNNG